MSILSSKLVLSPYDKTEECAQIVVSDAREQFTLGDIATVGIEYTISLWIKSEATGGLTFLGQSIPTTSGWSKFMHTFTAQDTNLVFDFDYAGTYYIFHPQLEAGNVTTDWSLSPDDINELAKSAKSAADEAQGTADDASDRITAAESIIEQLSNQIAMLVTDGNGTSLMTQTSNGWTFRIQNLQDAVNATASGLNSLTSSLGSTNQTVDILKRAVDDLEEISEYVTIGVYQGEPCIELGEADSDFKLLITNTRIMFMEGGSVPTYIDNDGLITENIKVTNEFRQGGFAWAVRQNGNYGLMWKGGN